MVRVYAKSSMKKDLQDLLGDIAKEASIANKVDIPKMEGHIEAYTWISERIAKILGYKSLNIKYNGEEAL